MRFCGAGPSRVAYETKLHDRGKKKPA